MNANKRLYSILDTFLSVVVMDQSKQTDDFVSILLDIYYQKNVLVVPFTMDESETFAAMRSMENLIVQHKLDQRLRSSVSYLLNEFVCNMQQHAQVDAGYGFLQINNTTNTIDIVLADRGIGIYGSYVSAQKYLDEICNSDVRALLLAKEGYSTKNLPNAENRGYGISSNIKMIVKGLNGDMSILSGNALLLCSADGEKIIELPEGIEWNGTMVIATIPTEISESYNIYNYIS